MWMRIAILGTLLAAAALAADGPGDDAANKRQLAKIKNDPEHVERLRQNLAAYRAMPADRQQQLRKLDKALHEQDPAERERLRAVMERYAGWLARLDAEDRAQVLAAAPGPDRLRVIGELLDRQWQDGLSQSDKDKLAQATPDERLRLLEDLRKEQKARRDLRLSARRTVDEAAALGSPEFRERVAEYIEETLRPLAVPGEDIRLGSVRPNLIRNAYELGTKRGNIPFPGPAPPGKSKAVRSWKDLPAEWVSKFPSPTPSAIAKAEGKWPEFAVAVASVARQKGIDLPANLLGPTKLGELPASVKRFVANDLMKLLTDDQKQQLAAAEGKWPDYPKKVKELADRHQRQVPGLRLPGTPEQWQPILNARANKGK